MPCFGCRGIAHAPMHARPPDGIRYDCVGTHASTAGVVWVHRRIVERLPPDSSAHGHCTDTAHEARRRTGRDRCRKLVPVPPFDSNSNKKRATPVSHPWTLVRTEQGSCRLKKSRKEVPLCKPFLLRLGSTSALSTADGSHSYPSKECALSGSPCDCVSRLFCRSPPPPPPLVPVTLATIEITTIPRRTVLFSTHSDSS